MVEMNLGKEMIGGMDGFDIFLSQTSEYRRVLKAHEEKELARKIKDNDTEALEKLCNHNIRLVISVAKRYVRFSGNMVIDDLVQEGYFGLRIAAERFDPESGYKFSTYATHWIRQSILRAVRNKSSSIRIPVHQYEKMQKIIAVQNQLRIELGREPFLSEISESTGLKENIISRAILYDYHEDQLHDITTNRFRNNLEKSDADYSLIMRDINNPDPEILSRARLEIDEICKEITKICSMIHDKRNLKIFCMRFGLYSELEPTSLECIAKKFKLTRERIRQIVANHFRRLKKAKIYNGNENHFFVRVQSLLDLCDYTGTDFHNLKY